MKLIRKYWLEISILFLIFITSLSLLPLPAFPEVPGKDKTSHMIAYAILVLPISIRLPKKWYWILITFWLWSGAIELIQPYVNRYGEWLDFAANSLGIILGLMMGRLINWIFPSHQ